MWRYAIGELTLTRCKLEEDASFISSLLEAPHAQLCAQDFPVVHITPPPTQGDSSGKTTRTGGSHGTACDASCSVDSVINVCTNHGTNPSVAKTGDGGGDQKWLLDATRPCRTE